MSFNIKQQLELAMGNIESNIKLPSINEQSASVVGQQLLKSTSVLGGNTGQVQGGFQAMTASVDDVVSKVASSLPAQSTGQLNVAQLTDAIPEVAAQLKPVVDSVKATDLTAITGTASAAATEMMNVVIAMPTPEAIAASVKRVVPTASADILAAISTKAVNLNIPFKSLGQVAAGASAYLPDATNLLKQAIGDITGSGGGFGTQLSKLTGSINKEISAALGGIASGFPSIMENVVETLFSPAGNLLDSVNKVNGVARQINSSDKTRVIELATAGDYKSAIKIMQKYSDASSDKIEEQLRKIDNSASAVATQPVQGVSLEASSVASREAGWSGASTPNYFFTTVGTGEELEAELRSNTRPVTEVLIGCTNTGTNDNLTASDLHDRMKDYNVGILYHYVITRDGQIQRGRPVNIETESLSTLGGHHELSITVGLVGGLTIPTGDTWKNGEPEDTDKFFGKSYTASQWKALKKFCDITYKVYNGIQIVGTQDVKPARNGIGRNPHFDVPAWIESIYYKKLIVDTLIGRGPITVSELKGSDQAIEANAGNVSGGANP